MSSFPRYLLKIAGLAGLYYGTGWFGLNFASVAETVSPVWPPSGLALSFLLLGGWKTLPAIVLGVFTVEYFHGLPLSSVFIITAGNTLEAICGCYFLHGLAGFHIKMDRSRDVVALAFGAVLAPLFAASCGLLGLWQAGLVQPQDVAAVWTTWWSGDVLGILVITPLILSCLSQSGESFFRVKIGEALTLMIGLTVVCRLVFTTNFGGPVSDSVLAFLTFSFLLWAALRFGMRGAATASALVAFVAIQSVEAFSGPFRAASIGENVWLLQTFQAVSSLTSLIVAALISEKVASNLALHTSELRLHETQKYESLGIMAGGIAHDFNNLLTAILCHAEILQIRQKGNMLVEEHTGEIQKAGLRASALCQQMVAFSGCSIVADVSVDLNEWLRDHLEKIEPTLPSTMRLQTIFHVDPLLVNIHPEQLLQVVRNLFDNALEAYEDQTGMVEMETGLRKIDDNSSRHNLPSLQVPMGNYVFMTVRDNGVGMVSDVKDRIFEPFFSTKFTGRGLGLAFVLGIVRGHQGTLQVISQPGKGTEITVLLPIRTTPAEIAVRPPLQPSEHSGDCYIMVDDDDLVREITVQLLEKTGAKVFSASNGVDALRIYEANLEEIDVALIDWIMPGMMGYEVARAILALKPAQAVILTSGFTNEEVSLDLPGNGRTTFLPKPFTTRDIMAKVQEVTG